MQHGAMPQQRCCFSTGDPGLRSLTSTLICFARKNPPLPRAVLEVVQLGVAEADPGTTTAAPCPRNPSISLPAPVVLTLAGPPCRPHLHSPEQD